MLPAGRKQREALQLIYNCSFHLPSSYLALTIALFIYLRDIIWLLLVFYIKITVNHALLGSSLVVTVTRLN